MIADWTLHFQYSNNINIRHVTVFNPNNVRTLVRSRLFCVVAETLLFFAETLLFFAEALLFIARPLPSCRHRLVPPIAVLQPTPPPTPPIGAAPIRGGPIRTAPMGGCPNTCSDTCSDIGPCHLLAVR